VFSLACPVQNRKKHVQGAAQDVNLFLFTICLAFQLLWGRVRMYTSLVVFLIVLLAKEFYASLDSFFDVKSFYIYV
jgi:hypothetical protein